MKTIAIPTRAGMVDDHFGHCESFTIITLHDGGETETESLLPPEGCGCKSNLTEILTEKGVNVLLGGNMGDGAYHKLQNAGIEVIRGCAGPVKLVLELYKKGILKDNGEACHHHEEGHSCGGE